MSALLKIWSATEGESTALVLKTFGRNFILRADRNSFVTVMRVAAAGGVGAHVHAEFNNGVVYDFTPGDICDPDVMPHDEHLRRYHKYHSELKY